jgi:hypothetical protein
MAGKIKRRINIWAEGRFIDLWTVVHFLTGVLLGFTLFIFDFPIPLIWVFVVVLVFLVLWELFEYIRKIKETAGNRIVDILIAVVGFALTMFAYPILEPEFANIIGIIILVIYLTLGLSGWLAYEVRTKKGRRR